MMNQPTWELNKARWIDTQTSIQTKEIYKNEYWDNTRIPEIKNDRIRDAVFDMNVMGGAGKTVQRALNSFLDANLIVDGAIGSATIKSINAIPDSKVNEFMVALKNERIDYHWHIFR